MAQSVVEPRWDTVWMKPATKRPTTNTTDPETGTAGREDADGGDIAAIQNDDWLSAVDRVDLIASQSGHRKKDDNETQHSTGKP
ncbi:hypothetical protein [Pseudarthrobacter sp. S9]|uniref:hypothetical protein n=1 Tax=Pseudarthrobacter sp. S9 TaxID=3418421 RepID=UPI003D01407D